MISKRIGIDFHGVISHNCDFFRRFADFVLTQGYEIYIISGGPYKYIKDYLHQKKIPYNELWCILDYYISLGIVTFHEDGSFYMDYKLWNTAKGKYCASNNIAVMIDDSIVYGQHFTTPYCWYDKTVDKGYLKDKVIDFNHNPVHSFNLLCKSLEKL